MHACPETSSSPVELELGPRNLAGRGDEGSDWSGKIVLHAWTLMLHEKYNLES